MICYKITFASIGGRWYNKHSLNLHIANGLTLWYLYLINVFIKLVKICTITSTFGFAGWSEIKGFYFEENNGYYAYYSTWGQMHNLRWQVISFMCTCINVFDPGEN